MRDEGMTLLTALLKQETIRALTLTEPWCSLMATKHKHVETRSWSTSYRGPLALHAAKAVPRDLDDVCCQPFFFEALRHEHLQEGRWRFPVGHVLAIGMLEEVVPTETIQVSERERAFGNYAPNRFAWRFSALYRLETPLLARGSLGLWRWTPPERFWNEIQAIRDRLAASQRQGGR